MPIMTAALLAATALSVAGEPALTITARLDEGTPSPGQTRSFTVELKPGDGWTLDEAGIPGPILQLNVPASITLEGKVLESLRELARNEFLQEPYERMIEPGITSIGFTIDALPSRDATIGINVVGYAKQSSSDGNRYAFVRRRVDLPLASGATVTSSERATRSSWGVEPVLHIGDEAPDFALPRGDGTSVRLSALRGAPVIVTTYRAFW